MGVRKARKSEVEDLLSNAAFDNKEWDHKRVMHWYQANKPVAASEVCPDDDDGEEEEDMMGAESITEESEDEELQVKSTKKVSKTKKGEPFKCASNVFHHECF